MPLLVMLILMDKCWDAGTKIRREPWTNDGMLGARTNTLLITPGGRERGRMLINPTLFIPTYPWSCCEYSNHPCSLLLLPCLITLGRLLLITPTYYAFYALIPFFSSLSYPSLYFTYPYTEGGGRYASGTIGISISLNLSNKHLSPYETLFTLF